MGEITSAKTAWPPCPRCGGNTRTQIRPHTVVEDFPLVCPKCRHASAIRLREGKMQEVKMPDI